MPFLLGFISLILIAGCASDPMDKAGESPAFVIKDPNGKTAISPKDLSCISFQKNGKGQFNATFRLNPEGAKKFHALTSLNVGNKISVEVCGKQNSSPRIREAISGETATAFALSEIEKDCLLKRLKLPSCK